MFICVLVIEVLSAQLCIVEVQSDSNIMPLFVHCSMWWYIEGGGKLKHGVVGKLWSQNLVGCK